MNCFKTIRHEVGPGDTIYQIAKKYETTIPEILIYNQDINPYNLRVGAKLVICQGEDLSDPSPDVVELNQELRKAWERLAYWTRMYLVSVAENIEDEAVVEERLKKIPREMTNIFLKFYPGSVTYQLEEAWINLINDSAALIRAAKANESRTADQLDVKITVDIENIANILSNMNINYDKQEVIEMLEEYLMLTKREVVARLEGQYQDEIITFDELEKHVVKSADYLTQGIVKQYMNHRM